jgi:hypothetical protein
MATQPDTRHEDAEKAAWDEDEADRLSAELSPVTAEAVSELERKKMKGWGRERRRLEGWPRFR